MKENRIKQSSDNLCFSVIAKAIMVLFALMCAVPFIYLIAVSLSSSEAVLRGEVFLWPKEFTLDVYRAILKESTIIFSLVRSIWITLVYAVVSMIMTILCAYPLAESRLVGRKVITKLIIFTMYFSGGMIPSYLLVNSLGLIDSYWALILPGCLSTYNMIVLRSFFISIPESLKEAAYIDGAGDFAVLTRIVLPISKAALATVSLFYFVSRWNGFMDAMLYINDPTKTVLQIRLKQLIQNVGAMNELLAMEGGTSTTDLISKAVRAGCLMVSVIPILVIYPFLQKYFTKGAMIGSVKG